MPNHKIPFVDLQTQYQDLKAQVDAAIAATCARGDFILGDDVKLFEQEFAAFCRVPHCVAVANGTDALHLALLACGIGPGAEVITCTHTFVASVMAIHAAGAKVRLHICGRTGHLVDAFATLGCDIVDLDSLVDLRAARTRVGPRQVLLGNVNTVSVVRNGTADDVRRALRQCARDAGPAWISGAACEVPRLSPLENVRCFAEVNPGAA